MKYDIICIGSALLDVFVKSNAFQKVANGSYADGVALCEEYGGKTEVEEMKVVSGGAGTNCAVSFARKGLKTALIAEIGRDLIASTIKQELVREDVDLMLMSEVDGEVTGMSVILVAPDGGRSALIYRGASKMLTKEDIRWDQIKAKWLYISALGGEVALLEGLLGHANTFGIQAAVNPGKPDIEKLNQLDKNERQKMLGWMSVLMVNREEAALLTGLSFEQEEVWRGDWWIEGPETVVVTDGRNGGVILTKGKKVWYEPKLVEVVEETGAGDAFGSGLVTALIHGKDLMEAVEWGKKQAASVVSHMGAKEGLLKMDEVIS
jgi:ribokinase